MNNGWRLIAVEGEEKFDEVGLTWGKGLSATHAAQRRKDLHATQNEDISWFFHAPSSAFCLSPLDACVSVRTAPAALVSSDQKLNAALPHGCLRRVCRWGQLQAQLGQKLLDLLMSKGLFDHHGQQLQDLPRPHIDHRMSDLALRRINSTNPHQIVCTAIPIRA